MVPFDFRRGPFSGGMSIASIQLGSRTNVARHDHLFPRPYRNRRRHDNWGIRLCRLHTIGRLSWRPLLSFPCHRISYTEQDRFCGPAAQAALPSEILCRCMPDIFAQSGLRMASSQMAFSLHSLKHTVARICSTNGFETVGPRNVPRDQPTRSSRRRNESHSLSLIPALRVKSGTSPIVERGPHWHGTPTPSRSSILNGS
jgi:hypothetical protein